MCRFDSCCDHWPWNRRSDTWPPHPEVEASVNILTLNWGGRRGTPCSSLWGVCHHLRCSLMKSGIGIRASWESRNWFQCRARCHWRGLIWNLAYLTNLSWEPSVPIRDCHFLAVCALEDLNRLTSLASFMALLSEGYTRCSTRLNLAPMNTKSWAGVSSDLSKRNILVCHSKYKTCLFCAACWAKIGEFNPTQRAGKTSLDQNIRKSRSKRPKGRTNASDAR